MIAPLLKSKNSEISQNDFEPLETDEKKEENPKKKNTPSLFKYILILIILLVIGAGIYYYKYYKRFSSPLNKHEALLEEYNKLGKKYENLHLYPPMEYFIAQRDSKYICANIIFHFDKNDIDKNKLLKAIKTMIKNQAILQSIFYEKNGRYYVKFDPNAYPEIISADIKESEYDKYLYDMGYDMDFPLNKLMYKVYLITTEKYYYCIFVMHHAIYDIYSQNGIVYTFNHTYLGDLNEIQLKKNDLFYSYLYEYNLKLKNEKNFIKEVQDYYMKNYDLGRSFKNFHKDKDIQKPVKDSVNIFYQMSDKALKDKIYNIFEGNLSKINIFNMMCQLYTLYLYNNMEDNVPEIVYLRHGRNLTLYRNTIGCFFQIAIIKYDFIKNTKKVKDKIYLNVQDFYDKIKKQFDEQKFISQYFTSFEDYDFINDIQNVSMGQLSLPDEDNFIPDNIFGKKLLEKTKATLYYVNKEKMTRYFVPLLFQNQYKPSGILNLIIADAEDYKVESLKNMSNILLKVVAALSDGFLNKDKLIEIKI